jgi:hypothetical protein
MKYAMIPVNRKYDNKNQRIVRRVLVSYKYKYKNGKYMKTKLIDLDPYFKDPKSSQQYEFTDKYFFLKSNAYGGMLQNSLLNKKRLYTSNAGLLIEKAIEFEAPNNEEAIKIFSERLEAH